MWKGQNSGKYEGKEKKKKSPDEDYVHKTFESHDWQTKTTNLLVIYCGVLQPKLILNKHKYCFTGKSHFWGKCQSPCHILNNVLLLQHTETRWDGNSISQCT